MFKIFRDFFGNWTIIPFDGGGSAVLGLLCFALCAAVYISLCGWSVLIPLIMSFLVPFLMFGLFIKIKVAPAWLCILHGIFMRLYIDIAFEKAIKGNPQGMGLINIIILFMVLLVGVGALVFMCDEHPAVMFVILPTNALYFLHTVITKIDGFTSSILFYSTIIQVLIVAIVQVQYSKGRA